MRLTRECTLPTTRADSSSDSCGHHNKSITWVKLAFFNLPTEPEDAVSLPIELQRAQPFTVHLRYPSDPPHSQRGVHPFLPISSRKPSELPPQGYK